MFIDFFISDDFNLNVLQNEYILGVFFEMLIEKSKVDKVLTNVWSDLNKLLILIKNDRKYSLYEDDTYQDLMNKINTLEILKREENES